MIQRPKVSIIGGGNVGTACAYQIVKKELGNVTIVDIEEKLPIVKGLILEISECSPIDQFDATLKVSSEYKDIEKSDIVIVTAGFPRHPGMTRDDLIQENLKIMKNITIHLNRYCPESIVVVVTNPVDTMTYFVWKETELEKSRVIGHSGCLDNSRFKTFIAEKLGVSKSDIQALIIGSHGDEMVPLIRFTSVSGIPITNLLSDEEIEYIVNRTKHAGTEIVSLKGISAYYTPGVSITEIIEAIVKDKNRILPCSVLCEKEYGVGGYCIGVPCIINRKGVKKIIELELNYEESALLNMSIDHIEKLIHEQLTSSV